MLYEFFEEEEALNKEEKLIRMVVGVTGSALFAFILFLLVAPFFDPRGFTVEGSSMEPSLSSGDKVFTSDEKPSVGDVVVASRTNGARVVKRLVGVPGDKLSYNKEEMELTVGERIVAVTGSCNPVRSEVTLTSDFLVGDNRGASEDSASSFCNGEEPGVYSNLAKVKEAKSCQFMFCTEKTL